MFSKCFSRFIYAAAFFLCLPNIVEAKEKVVHLTPPDLQSVMQEIVCVRPMREGRFNLSYESVDGKTIVNCYGHGGSGWTTLFGSVEKAITLFEEGGASKERPIRVIGSGCMGLTSAIELSRRGYKISGISTKSLYDTPSWRAAGYFALVSVKTSPEAEAELEEIGMNTFLTYQSIDRGEHPYIGNEAVRFMPVYCSKDTDCGVENLEERGLIPPKVEVTLDFGAAVHKGFYEYKTYFMNTTTLMRSLLKEVERLGIPIEYETIGAFQDVEEDQIFNCSGLGGKKLNEDSLMKPVRGHLFMLMPSAESGHMDYMIYTKVKQEGKAEYVYMFPKDVSVTPENPEGKECSGCLGGTFILNVEKLDEEEQSKLDALEFQRLLDRNSLFFYGSAA